MGSRLKRPLDIVLQCWEFNAWAMAFCCWGGGGGGCPRALSIQRNGTKNGNWVVLDDDDPPFFLLLTRRKTTHYLWPGLPGEVLPLTLLTARHQQRSFSSFLRIKRDRSRLWELLLFGKWKVAPNPRGLQPAELFCCKHYWKYVASAS